MLIIFPLLLLSEILGANSGGRKQPRFPEPHGAAPGQRMYRKRRRRQELTATNLSPATKQSKTIFFGLPHPQKHFWFDFFFSHLILFPVNYEFFEFFQEKNQIGSLKI